MGTETTTKPLRLEFGETLAAFEGSDFQIDTLAAYSTLKELGLPPDTSVHLIGDLTYAKSRQAMEIDGTTHHYLRVLPKYDSSSTKPGARRDPQQALENLQKAAVSHLVEIVEYHSDELKVGEDYKKRRARLAAATITGAWATNSYFAFEGADKVLGSGYASAPVTLLTGAVAVYILNKFKSKYNEDAKKDAESESRLIRENDATTFLKDHDMMLVVPRRASRNI